MKALVEIHRKDWHSPFVHEVYWKEAVQRKRDGTPTSFWTKMPKFQLKKVAISQGFRLAFPSELGGMPYDSAELPDGESVASTVAVAMVTTSAEPVETVQSSIPDSPAANAIPLRLGASQHPATEHRLTAPLPRHEAYQAHPDPYPGEDRAELIERLDTYLAEHAEAFTDRHYEWVMDKAHKAKDREGVLKMLSYAAKVVKNGVAVASASA